MAAKTIGESMSRNFMNENNEIIASSSVSVGLNTSGSLTITFQDAQKLKDSQTIADDLKTFIDDVLTLSAKYVE
ncbi:hypothetical protein GHI93_03070 [Lactococcus hircilactis]|uniref:Uncharacterized protein n=1 Tax=Lactococcus hircilactis TaxID=1494462 RepID=A0A7X2D037_9LACT|nr:hypothetical protein [Lactococcus hircilactis]MQW38933.1 hypothetical protein [Lactococcus hircilactis]